MSLLKCDICNGDDFTELNKCHICQRNYCEICQGNVEHMSICELCSDYNLNDDY